MKKTCIIFLTIISFFCITSVYAHETIGGSTNCQPCHAEYTEGSAWHTDHQVLANNDCTVCHITGSGGDEVFTSSCTPCHSNLPCDWVNEHEEDNRASCFTCHTTCEDTTSEPCPSSYLLGDEDPRLSTLRKFRNKVLAQNKAGQALIALYYKSEGLVIELLEANPALKQYARRALEALLPAIEKLTDNK